MAEAAGPNASHSASPSARRLATLRIGTGLFVWIYLCVRTPHVLGFIDFPASRFSGVGLCAPLASAPAAAWVWLATLAVWPLGLAFVLGWRFRICGPLFAVVAAFVLSYRNSFGMVFHTENLALLHLVVLALAPSATVLSWDAGAGRSPGSSSVEAEARWAISTLCAITVATYFVAGLAKLRFEGWSTDWMRGELLRAHVAFDNLRKVELGHVVAPLGPWLVRQGWVFAPLAWATLLLEVGAPLALVHRRVGRWWAVAAWGFHFGVLWTMAILFPYPLAGVGLASFFEAERVWETRGGRAFLRAVRIDAGAAVAGKT